MSAIFLSYRRSDSQDVTGRIYDRLVARFSAKQVFKDVDSIPLGVSFPRHIQQLLSRAGVVLVIIGPAWLNATDEQGRRRLDDANDFVRLEVETALRGGVPVIPILVSNASMPPAGELPRSMQPLVARNGIPVRPDPDFNNDIGRLFAGLDNLDKLLGAKSGPVEVKPFPAGALRSSRRWGAGAKSGPVEVKPLPGSPLEGGSRRPPRRAGPAPPRPSSRGTTAAWRAVGTVALLLLAVGLWLVLRADGPAPAGKEAGKAKQTEYKKDAGKPPPDAPKKDKDKEAARFHPRPGTRAGAVAVNPLGMRFAWCPPGSFRMGSHPKGEAGQNTDETPHRVTLTKGFYLGVYPVMQMQWRTVMGTSPSFFKGDTRPVECVTWQDCQAFCKKLGQKDGRRYRLPTEAEWEYACRAGTTTAYNTGNGLEALKRAGWCSYDGKPGSAEGTKPVAQFAANAWGLFDMHGNVFQPCADAYIPYPAQAVVDPVNRQKGSGVAYRGGSWKTPPALCRSAMRFGGDPAAKAGGYEMGCRVVLCPD